MREPGDLLLAPTAQPEGGDWWWKVWRAGAVSVLVVSESSVWRSEMAALLEAEGFAVRLDDRGDAALEPSCPFDVAVVDLAITGRPAAAVFAALRARSSLPILAVSSASRSSHRDPALLAAYAAGADQAVARSDRPRELMARIRALLRRCPPTARGATPIAAGVESIRLDLAASTATVAGAEVRLSLRERDVLHALLQRAGRVVRRDELARGGGARTKHEVRALDSVVRSVRKKLEAAEGRRRIVVVRGVGFRLMPDAELDAGAPCP